MGEKTGIQWTDATWNPVWGCDKVSPGCKNCYAERIALSMAGRMHPGHGSMWRAAREMAFDFRTVPGRLQEPLKWKQPRMIFVNSMSDLFHQKCPDEYINEVFKVMEEANWHIYQVLTKRPDRMLAWTTNFRPEGVDPHIWLGTSVELSMFLHRVDLLRVTNVPVRFVSFEPLLGEIPEPELKQALEGISWAITGGESDYKDPRAADPAWFRGIRDACLSMGIPYFHKQNGGSRKCECHHAWGCRLLDGRTWDGFPAQAVQPSSAPTLEAFEGN